MRLDQLPLRRSSRIIGVAWEQLSARAARRLQELGFDAGVAVEALHHGPVGLDPIACRVGRMTVAIRRVQAAAVSVEPV